MFNRLFDLYQTKVIPELKNSFHYSNMEKVPHLTKVVINVGEGELHRNKPLSDSVLVDLGRITGQKPILTYAKKAVSSFKIREGNAVGAKVTLRGSKMYDFLDRTLSITIPRLRDFRGLSLNSFDGHGNYSFGFKDKSVFPEIPYESSAASFGVEVTVCTSAASDDEAKGLLQAFGFPFLKDQNKEQHG